MDMEHQNAKKRLVDQPSFYQSQKIYTMSSTPLQSQRSSQMGSQYYQYVTKVDHAEHQHYQQQSQNQNDQTHESQIVIQQHIPQQPTPQIVQYDYYEPPMTLNAWTQTNSDDFPSIMPPINPKNESILLAKIQDLERSLRIQADELEEIRKQKPRCLTPDPIATNRKTSVSSEFKHERTTYRILTQPNESNCETQIEIELSDDVGSIEPVISPPKVYAIETSPHTNVKHPYTAKDIKCIPKDVKYLPKDAKYDPKNIKCVSNDVQFTPKKTASDDSMTTLGPCDTKIATADYERIVWTSASIATRKLLTTIFDRETLATHSMTGKASPAFKDLDKPVKGRLDPNVIQDIVHIVSQKCGVSAKEVRSAITTKCADENKMLKLKQLKTSGSAAKKSILKECNKRTYSNKEN